MKPDKMIFSLCVEKYTGLILMDFVLFALSKVKTTSNMIFEELQQLFYNGELDLLIEKGEQYLTDNPSDLDSLILLAVAYHDRVFNEGHEVVYEVIADKVIPCLRRVLEQQPDHQQALYMILDYPLDNQFDLLQIGQIRNHITQDNKDEFIGYADRLIAAGENAGYGYDSKVRIYETLEDYPKLLETLDLAIAYCQEAFAANREVMDKNTSIFWMKKIYVLDHTKLMEQQVIVALIEKGINYFVSNAEYNYIDLAEIAYENQSFDVALSVLLKLINGDNSSRDIQDKLVVWHQRFEEAIKTGYRSNRVLYYQLIIERNYAALLNLDHDFYYHHARSCIASAPDDYAGYHFAGTYLFEEGTYEEALLLLEKAMLLGGGATTWRRLMISHYSVNGGVTAEVPKFADLPRDLYNEAIELDDFAMTIADEDSQRALRRLSLALYEQSYKAFADYFEKGRYNSDLYGGLHNRAMNCNNLAIVYAYFEEYNRAAEIAKEGLLYSEFQELHHTLIDALRKDGDFEGLDQALQTYFANYTAEEVHYYKHIQHLAAGVEVAYKLEKSNSILEEAEQLLYHIYDHYLANPDISDYDFRDFESAKNVVEGVVYSIMEHESVETRIAYYEARAKRYPAEAHAYYLLMQYYNEVNDYARMNEAARSYLTNKRSFLLDHFDRVKIQYLILKSYYFMGLYTEACVLFTEQDIEVRKVMEPADYVLWLGYAVKAYGKIQDIEQVSVLADRYEAIYEEQGWSFDTNLEEVYLTRALVYYEQGDLKEAHRILDHVLSYDDHSEAARGYKKTWKKPGLFSRFGF